MKLFEKMATQSAAKEYSKENVFQFDAHVDGYKSGFFAAREMAFKLWEDEDMTSSNLASLGESEAE